MIGTETEVNRQKIRRRLGNYLRIQGEQDGLLCPTSTWWVRKVLFLYPDGWYATLSTHTGKAKSRTSVKVCVHTSRKNARGTPPAAESMPRKQASGNIFLPRSEWVSSYFSRHAACRRSGRPMRSGRLIRVAKRCREIYPPSWLQLQWIQLIANHLLTAAAKTPASVAMPMLARSANLRHPARVFPAIVWTYLYNISCLPHECLKACGALVWEMKLTLGHGIRLRLYLCPITPQEFGKIEWIWSMI